HKNFFNLPHITAFYNSSHFKNHFIAGIIMKVLKTLEEYLNFNLSYNYLNITGYKNLSEKENYISTKTSGYLIRLFKLLISIKDRGFIYGESDQIFEIIKEMSGIGEGSTPLSDDFICGIICSLTGTGKLRKLEEIIGARFNELNTSEIPKIMILDSACGYIPLDIKKAIMIGHDQKKNKEEIEKNNLGLKELIETVGSDSGMGILMGFWLFNLVWKNVNE
ncbi:MAG: DUF2877 domain-containing protein, partial [Actinomycetia bacterium]|nr:DUF2877 domain-containing protein [Actinomycetes bacterium]